MARIENTRQDYWGNLLSILEKEDSRVLTYKRRPARAVYAPTLSFGLNKSQTHLWAGLNGKKKRVEVGLMLEGPSAEGNFRRLGLDKDWATFEKRLGTRLIYPESKRYTAMTFKHTHPYDRLNWSENQHWMVENLERFYDVFKPPVAKL